MNARKALTMSFTILLLKLIQVSGLEYYNCTIPVNPYGLKQG